jgi:hypothetical protein
LTVDFTKIYSPEEYNSITEAKQEERNTINKVTTNEDLLRYLGYDK